MTQLGDESPGNIGVRQCGSYTSTVMLAFKHMGPQRGEQWEQEAWEGCLGAGRGWAGGGV